MGYPGKYLNNQGKNQRRSKYKALLRVDKKFQLWYDGMAMQAKATADNYLRVMGHFLEYHKLTPAQFAAMDPDRRDDLLQRHIIRATGGELPGTKGKASGSYMKVLRKAVVSWLDANGLKLTKKIKVPGASQRPRASKAHVPTPEELRKILHVADPRSKTAIALMAFSGVRPEVLGNYDGSEGLPLGDFPELKIEGGQVLFDRTPAAVKVPIHISKIGQEYMTFLGPEGCEYLAVYLKQRTMDGEPLTLESPVLAPMYNSRTRVFLRSIKVSDAIRLARLGRDREGLVKVVEAMRRRR